MTMPCKRLFQGLVLLLCVLLTAQGALAAGGQQNDSPCSVTIRYLNEGEALPEVTFSVYQVAYAADSNEPVITDAFSGYSFDFDPQDTSSWRALANTLEAYVLRDGIQDVSQSSTQDDGSVTFEGLQRGLYLVSGESKKINSNTYTPEPVLVYLPYLDDDGAVQYDALIEPKKEVVLAGTVSVSVVKVWNDGQRESGRPSSITAQLLKGGEVYDTVELSRANNWRHTWTELDGDFTWRVTEKEIPQGYTAVVEREDTSYIITNTARADTPKTPGETKLPQTGMLLAPVFILAAAGCAALLIGVILRKRAR
ncbi:MAG: Cna B-type domain-containing protein [Oscillospiraceae bacterium]|nr:Cna B-type domain-containing protein [Oscillospiraceae bacterium]